MQYAIAALAFIGAVAAQEYGVPAYTPPAVYDTPAPYETPAPTTYDVTTSTAYATTERTVYQCPAYVTDCPSESKSVVVVTDTVALYTTVCPVTATETAVYSSAPVYSSEAPVYSSESAPVYSSEAPVYSSEAPVYSSESAPYYSATNTPVAPGAPQTYVTYGAPTPTYGAASDTAVGTTYYPSATESSAPIATGAAVRAGPAFGGLAVAAAVAMMM